MKNEIVLFTDGDVNGELNENSVGFSDKSTGWRKET